MRFSQCLGLGFGSELKGSVDRGAEIIDPEELVGGGREWSSPEAGLGEGLERVGDRLGAIEREKVGERERRMRGRGRKREKGG